MTLEIVIDRQRPASVAPHVERATPAPAKRKGPPTAERYPGWVCALIVFGAIIVTWSAIYFIVTAALSLGSGL